MSNFQGGINAGQLSPQAFSNSQQNTSFQNTYDPVSPSPQSINTFRSDNVLRVDDGGAGATLGVNSTQSSTTDTVVTVTQPSAQGGVSWTILVVLLIISAAAVIAYKKFTPKSQAANEELG